MTETIETPSLPERDVEKEKRLGIAITALEKEFGKGTILYNDNLLSGVEFIPSGCISLDLALGGGYGRGRIVEIYGPESSGKTTLALHAVAETQKLGEIAAFVDVEHALDPQYMTSLGIDVSRMPLSQPNCGEEALNIVDRLAKSGVVSLIVIDSVAALITKKEIEGDIGDAVVGQQARLMSQAMRKLTAVLANSNTCVIFINQIRYKIGVMFGNPETTSGGNALKFYASQRLDVRRTGSVKGSDDLISANNTKVKLVKNKLFPPYREALFEIEFGKGINVMKDLVTLASDVGIVDKNGAWYSYNDDRLGQGLNNTLATLNNNPSMKAEIIDAVYAHFNI